MYSIRDMAAEDRPRERLLLLGPEAVSTAELLAIILGSGMKGKSVLELSQEILSTFGGVAGLTEASLEELCQIKGLGLAKAIQLKAAFSLGLRIARQPIPPRYIVTTPTHAYHFLKELLENEKVECFGALLLDTKGSVIRFERISMGTLSEALVHPRELFHPAIRHKAASIILAHNHPSGDPTPSMDDIEITRSCIQAGLLLDIPLKDHLIIGRSCYHSFKEKKVLSFDP